MRILWPRITLSVCRRDLGATPVLARTYDNTYMAPYPAQPQLGYGPEYIRNRGEAMPATAIEAMLGALDRANADMGPLATAADTHGVSPSLLAAIGIRETGFRNIAQIGGGFGRGTFQIDIGKNPQITEAQALNPAFAANWAASYLSTNMSNLAVAHPALNPSQLLQATAASYNFGTANISGNPNTIDQGTTGNNYGGNVLRLMDCFH